MNADQQSGPRIAIVHYHLHPGGVTRIIRSSLAALLPLGVQAVVLSGEASEREWPVPVKVVPGLGYEEWRTPRSATELARDLCDAAREVLGGDPDLWHIHNHSLGKNLAMPGAVRQLADQGRPLLLQAHDFAEDGRPALYRRQKEHLDAAYPGGQAAMLYPGAPHIHYALLNGRDHQALMRTGADTARVHALPNPVVMSEQPVAVPARDPGHPLWLYPTRAIRRKNLGEFLLWSAVAPAGHRFATTLAPQNPQERPIYEHWKELAGALGLPLAFELAARPGVVFEQLVASSHALVTTSVAEGFGMAFLEPWLAGRSICGRDLPAITHEFAAAGVQLSNLYPRLDLPLDWLQQDSLRNGAWLGLRRVMSAYGQDPRPEHLERTLDAWINGDHIDFGRLDEGLQETLIRHLVASPTDRAALRPAMLQLPDDAEATVADNAAAVRREYSLSHYGGLLMSIYRSLLDETPAPVEPLRSGAVLDSLLAPENLFLLRS